MYRIAICDNDGVDLGIIERSVKKYFSEHPQIEVTIKTFLYSYDLKLELENRRKYDLYLLDIMMPEVDGISLGRIIRENTSTTPIVFITSTKEMAYEAFGLNALQYITKPINEAKLQGVLDFAYSLYKNRPQTILTIKAVQGIIKIAQEDIMFVENDLRTAVYHMADGSVYRCSRRSGSFEKAIYPLNTSESFVQPHKSYFVNLKFIKFFQDSLITMDDDTVIPVNQHRMTNVRKIYLEYLSQFGAGGYYIYGL